MATRQIRRILALSASIATLIAPAALADEVVDETVVSEQANSSSKKTDTTDTDDELRRDTVYVTARRREERLQDVPLALSAFNDQGLEQQSINDLADLTGKVSGLVSGNSLGGGRSTPTFAIRGQSQQELASIADPSVSLYVNDVPVPRAHGANMSFFDIASVEVAKGPQGTLFGRNTTGGAILVRTQRPTDEFEGYVSQEVGNFGTYVTEGAINLPLGENAALRLAGQHRESDGFLKDEITGKKINTVDEDGIRATLSFKPASGVENITTLSYAEADNGGTGGLIFNSSNALFQPGLADQQARNIYTTASGVPMFTRIKTTNFDNQTTIELTDSLTLKNIFGYRDLDYHALEDLDGVEDIIFPVERIVTSEQFSEELQLQGTFDKLDFILGAFYFTEDASDQALTAGKLTQTILVDPGDIEPGSISGYFPNYSNTWVKPTNTSYAIFFQGNYQLTNKLALTAGLRQNWDEREVTILNRSYIAALSTTDQSCRFTLDEDNDPTTAETRPAITNCAFTDSTDYDELTYNLSLEYQPHDGVLYYVAHRHGYRTGGYSARGNSQATLSDTFEPEFVDDVELGLKADWHINGTFLRTNLATYYAKYKDMQRILIEGISPPVTVTANAGKASIYGAELDFLFRPNEFFELSGFYSYTKGEFDEFITPNGDDFSNQRFPRAPENAYSLTATLYPDIPDKWGDMRLALTYTHQDEYDYNDDYTLEATSAGAPIPSGIAANAAQIIEAQDLLNLNLGLDGVLGSPVNVSAYVNNITDEEYLLPYMGIQGLYEARTPGAPRTYGVKLTYSF